MSGIGSSTIQRVEPSDYIFSDGYEIMKQAVYYIDARDVDAGAQSIANKGSARGMLATQVGSTGSADTNDPTHLWHLGNAPAYLDLPGASGAYVTIPDESALDITGDLEIVRRIAADDWTPAAGTTLVGKWDSGSNQRSYRLDLIGGGLLTLWWSDNGTTTLSASSTAGITATDGTALWVKVTIDVDNGAGGRTVRFWTAADASVEPSSWTQLGADVTTAGVTSIHAGTSGVHIGALFGGTSNLFDGKDYRTIIRSGIGSAATTVLDVDFTKLTQVVRSFTCATGQTVTINGTAKNVVKENYLYLPGAASNQYTIAHSASLDLTGDLEMVVRLGLPDWTPATGQIPLRKWAANTGYLLQVNPAGTITVYWNSGGLASTSAVPFTDGQVGWIKATLDVDNGAGGHTVKFYTAPDQTAEPSSWTQLGSDVVGVGVTSILPSGTTLYGDVIGNYLRMIVRNGIGGPTVLDVNFTTGIQTGAETSFTCATGQTVTINRSTSGRKAVGVVRPCWLFGTDDYMDVADDPLLDTTAAQDLTAIVIARTWATSTAWTRFINKWGGAAPAAGWSLETNSSADLAAFIYDGTDPGNVAQNVHILGKLQMLGLEINRSTQLSRVLVDGVKGSTTASTAAVDDMSNTAVFRIGQASTGGGPRDMELFAVAVFKRVLTQDELTAIAATYGVAA